MDQIIIVLVKSLGRGEDLNIRQVTCRVGGKRTTLFDYLKKLCEHGFAVREEFRTEEGTRPYVIVRLGLLGYLYAIYKSVNKQWTLSQKEEREIIAKSYQEILRFLNQKYEGLREVFDGDPWSKLCFNALRLMMGKGEPLNFYRTVVVNVANCVIGWCIGPDEPLVPEYFWKIFRDEVGLCEAILQGLKNAHKDILLRGPIPQEEKLCLEAFAEAFTMLAEQEEKDVMTAFRCEYNSLMDTLIKKLGLPRKIILEYRHMRSKASLDEIVCLFECPKCRHKGPSVQELEKVLSSYTVKCSRCGSSHSLADLSRYVDEEIMKLCRKWAGKHISRHIRSLIEDALERTDSTQP